MKDKKKIITISLIALCAITIFGLLILALTSCDNKAEAKLTESNEVLQLNSLEKLNRVVLLNEGEVSSGIPSNITIEDEDMSGYQIASTFYYTPNMDRDKGFQKLKDYMLYYNGRPIHADYDITATFKDDRVTVTGTYPNGEKFSKNSPAVQIDALDGVEFMTCTPFLFSRYAIVISKNSIQTNYDINKIATYALKSRFFTFVNPQFDLNYNDSLQEENEIWSESYYQAGNGKYKSIMANVRILNGVSLASYHGHVNNDSYQPNEHTNDQMNQQFPENEAPDITNPDNPNYNNNPEPNNGNQEVINNGEVNNGEVNAGNAEANPNETPTVEDDVKSFGESIKQGFEDFKTNVESNTTFRTVTICVSSVIGIALLYVIFLIIRKIWRVIKN